MQDHRGLEPRQPRARSSDLDPEHRERFERARKPALAPPSPLREDPELALASRQEREDAISFAVVDASKEQSVVTFDSGAHISTVR